MKEKMNRFCLKHKCLAFLCYSIPLVAVYNVLMIILQGPMWAILFVDALIILASLARVSVAHIHLMNDAVVYLNNYCDPEPLYKETLEQQKFHKEANGQVMAINHCVALSEMGEYEQVIALLEEINIDKYAAMLPQSKFVYYNNLADAYFAAHNVEKFEVCYQKSQQILADIKNQKIQAQLRKDTALMPVQAHLIREEYAEALALLKTISCESKRKMVGHAFCTAKAYLGLEEKEKAVESLKYVIYNGNKCHVVVEANAMLEEWILN